MFRILLSSSLEDERDFTPFLRDRVNFCSLIPMRAVPFRHVFILGLNDADFPRHERAPGFNLMTLKRLHRRGDRSRGQDDRFLFLEALLSARESIYFSYIGESPVDQQVLNPSVVISELLDYLADNFTVPKPGPDAMADIRRRLVVREHLAAYNPENYVKEPERESGSWLRLPSFDPAFNLHRDDSGGGLEPACLCTSRALSDVIPPVSELTVDLSGLKNFLSNPPRTFLRQVLGIRLSLEEETELEDNEPFTLSPYQSAPFYRSLLRADADRREEMLQRSFKLGALPAAVFGARLRKELLENCAAKETAAW